VNARDVQRLKDIRAAIAAIQSHVQRGAITDGLVFDAVRLRLVEIGEAVKSISPAVLAAEASIPWAEVGRMRDLLAHRYFDTSHAIVQGTVDNDLKDRDAAVSRLLDAPDERETP
jgi:uncharacterized protein with HEPN domain